MIKQTFVFLIFISLGYADVINVPASVDSIQEAIDLANDASSKNIF